MGKHSTFAATTAGKSFCPRPPVQSRRQNLEAAVDSTRMLSVKQNPDMPFDKLNSLT
jgi:hypothetical protein